MPNIERLQKIADHLRNGKLGHDNFDFSVFSRRDSCGTLGCAIGELPFIFPEMFLIVEDKTTGFRSVRNRLFYQKGKEGSVYQEIGKFLDITADHADILFLPESQKPPYKFLYANATKEEVAENIELFIKLHSDK